MADEAYFEQLKRGLMVEIHGLLEDAASPENGGEYPNLAEIQPTTSVLWYVAEIAANALLCFERGYHLGQGGDEPMAGEAVAVNAEDEWDTLAELLKLADLEVDAVIIKTTWSKDYRAEAEELANAIIRFDQARHDLSGELKRPKNFWWLMANSLSTFHPLREVIKAGKTGRANVDDEEHFLPQTPHDIMREVTGTDENDSIGRM